MIKIQHQVKNRPNRC